MDQRKNFAITINTYNFFVVTNQTLKQKNLKYQRKKNCKIMQVLECS